MTNVVSFPTESVRRTTLAQLLQLSQEMLTLARQEAWEQALALQHERRAKLEQFFSQPTLTEAKETVVQGIQAMLQLDAELTQLLQVSREHLLNGVKQVNHQRHAIGAYSAT